MGVKGASMITDNERREVARRLRETGEELGSAALLWYHIAKALGVRTATDGKTACGMLADLIEPAPTSSDTGLTCDRDALLKLAEEMEDLVEAWGGKYPTNRVAAYARRIREALGG